MNIKIELMLMDLFLDSKLVESSIQKTLALTQQSKDKDKDKDKDKGKDREKRR
jgi:hypothetical protein